MVEPDATPPDVQQIDIKLRERVMSYCAPIWRESGRQTVVASGTMCIIKTSEAVFGVTNHHVLDAVLISDQSKARSAAQAPMPENGMLQPFANPVGRHFSNVGFLRAPARDSYLAGSSRFASWPRPPLLGKRSGSLALAASGCQTGYSLGSNNCE
jgi:hypothetical protein